jgi:SpoVK/Ycf46/Vps4 family AAA+-type ATPase
MRRITSLLRALFILLPTIMSVANANTLTTNDAVTASLIDKTMLSILDDIARAREGLANDPSTSACTAQIQNDLKIVQSDVEHLAQLFIIGAQMVDARDQIAVLQVTKAATNEFLTEAPSIRAETNRLMSDVCSKSPVLVAKAPQAVDLIDKAMRLVKSVSERLK